MIKNKYLNKEVEFLNIDKKIILKLKRCNINTIEDLWSLNRKILKNKGFYDNDINQIRVKLQLLSLDLNKKIYNN